MMTYTDLLVDNGWTPGRSAPAPIGHDDRVMASLNGYGLMPGDKVAAKHVAAPAIVGTIESVTIDGRAYVSFYDCPIEALGIAEIPLANLRRIR